MVVVVLVSVSVGMGFFVMGVWLVFGFFGFDIFIVYFVFWVSYCWVRGFEYFMFDRSVMCVWCKSWQGEECFWDLEFIWLNVDLIEFVDYDSLLMLCFKDIQLIIGVFLFFYECLEVVNVICVVIEK